MIEMSHIFVLSQPEFVTREVFGVLFGRRPRSFSLRLPFTRRVRSA